MSLDTAERMVATVDGWATVEEAARQVGLSYWKCRRLVAARNIKTRRTGHIIWVPLWAVQREVAEMGGMRNGR